MKNVTFLGALELWTQLARVAWAMTGRNQLAPQLFYIYSLASLVGRLNALASPETQVSPAFWTWKTG